MKIIRHSLVVLICLVALRCSTPIQVDPVFCKQDCDCVKVKQVCEKGICQAINRANTCVVCSGACKVGDPCLNADNSIGTCPEKPTACTTDCNCLNKGACDGQKCSMALSRANMCPACSGTCKVGEPCYNADQSLGTCQEKPTACKHDCDCAKTGMVCQDQTCQRLGRASFCIACSGACKVGDPCLQSDGSIGVCQEKPTACKHDCDCIKLSMVCQDQTCQPLKRMTLCMACNGACKVGDPCLQNDGSMGVCQEKPTVCKHDCDCIKLSMVCQDQTCQPLKRMTLCMGCSSTCKPGDPCLQTDGSIGVCPGTKTCQHDCDCVEIGACINGECRVANRLNTCTCQSGVCVPFKPCVYPDGVIGTCGGAAVFICGDKQCMKGPEYCLVVIPGVCGGTPVPPNGCPANCTATTCPNGQQYCLCRTYTCRPLPAGCTTCDCLKKNMQCPVTCQDDQGVLTVSCPAP